MTLRPLTVTDPARDSDEALLARLLDKMHAERGWDFRGYKKSSLKRRLMKRLSARGVASIGDYIEVVDADPGEYSRLFSSVTIKVSEFFRGFDAFEAAREAMASAPGRTLRVWCCGCARGEEAYSLAMIAADTFGPEAADRVRIYATDIDAEAIESARVGEYRRDFVRNVPERLMSSYLTERDGLFKVKYEIRNLVKFGRLDIVRDHPLPRIDMLFCRNLFIYFDKRLQERIFEKLDAAVLPGGLLAFGNAEKVPSAFVGGYERLDRTVAVYVKRGAS